MGKPNINYFKLKNIYSIFTNITTTNPPSEYDLDFFVLPSGNAQPPNQPTLPTKPLSNCFVKVADIAVNNIGCDAVQIELSDMIDNSFAISGSGLYFNCCDKISQDYSAYINLYSLDRTLLQRQLFAIDTNYVDNLC
jgi:hypothetical protein